MFAGFYIQLNKNGGKNKMEDKKPKINWLICCALCGEDVSIDGKKNKKSCKVICGQCIDWILTDLSRRGFKIKAPKEYFGGEVDQEYPGHGVKTNFPNLVY